MLEEINEIKSKITKINAEKIRLETNKENTEKELNESVKELESFDIKPEQAEKVIAEKEQKLKEQIKTANTELEKIRI